MRPHLIALVLATALVLAACTSSSETTTTTTASPPAPTITTSTTTTTSAPPASTTTAPPASAVDLRVMLMWHQHQPLYPKDADGVVTRPWVRVHATKDYYDMAAMLREFPGVKATFNLTPVLLLQLEELAGGAKDAYWVHAEVPAADLSADQRRFVFDRFFDTNPRVVDRFPRYRELAGLRAQGIEAFGDQDFLDLQVLFNLAWTDPDFLAEEPLASLVAKGRGYAEADKQIVFAEHLRIIGEVVPVHRELWESGQIEVTTTPLAHPILPLISDTSLASVGDPTALLPANPYREIADAREQVRLGLDEAERLFGRRPRGMWPAEGAVAQFVMPFFAKEGVEWVATGEDVLAPSLRIGSFTRDSADTVQEAALLYRPWLARNPNDPDVAMFFRDRLISDLIGFQYSGMSAAAAVEDLMGRLGAIRDRLAAEGAAGPHVVSLILDGENAWEHYPNDGKDFLRGLYGALEASDFVTTTPSEFLAEFGDSLEPLDDVHPGAWFSANYATWIGEPEEATAWEYLFRARRDLRRAEQAAAVPAADLDAAHRLMLFAEGSDWFWWFGADQDSQQDEYFGAAFRELLGQMYDRLGEGRPAYLDVPIIPERAVAASATPADLVTVAVDASVDDASWASAGLYEGAADDPVAAVRYGFDKQHLYLRVDFARAAPPGGFDAYLAAPTGSKRPTTLAGAALGFSATRLVQWRPGAACLYTALPPPALATLPECLPLAAGEEAGRVELAVPVSELGALEEGDVLLFKVDVGGALFPGAGPAQAQVPNISDVEAILAVTDPAGDDHGPGTYTYPLDPVFVAGVYDLVSFEVGRSGSDLVFAFESAAPIQNPWGSPNGLSVQTFDVYVDKDPGAGTGARILLPGRNAALQQGNGWEHAVTLEGWASGFSTAEADGSVTDSSPTLKIAVLGDRGRVIARVPEALFGGGDPADWGYAVALLSQEGFPSPGVRRVRDVEASASQWRAGGGPADTNHTRILDLLAAPGDQEALLGAYPPSSAPVDDLGPDDFAQVPLFVP